MLIISNSSNTLPLRNSSFPFRACFLLPGAAQKHCTHLQEVHRRNSLIKAAGARAAQGPTTLRSPRHQVSTLLQALLYVQPIAARSSPWPRAAWFRSNTKAASQMRPSQHAPPPNTRRHKGELVKMNSQMAEGIKPFSFAKHCLQNKKDKMSLTLSHRHRFLFNLTCSELSLRDI